jgi:predicted GNAT family acetyltransferase
VLAASAVEGVTRLSHAYTPPELRGKGFGAAAVAGSADVLRRRGAAAVMLNADAHNPITNRIYRRMGFEPVGRAREWALRPVSRDDG